MQRITFDRPWPLFDTATTRAIEAAATAALPPHTLMQRAGQAIAKLARALAPHARCIWFACGSGNNGGDGLEAAMLLHCAGYSVVVTWLGSPETAPPDALLSWQRARDAGVVFVDEPPPLGKLGRQDLVVDALLGIGITATAHQAEKRLSLWLEHMRDTIANILHIDVPSGLLADTGQWAEGYAPTQPPRGIQRHTLSLLTLHPGLFTACGLDAAGTVWLDDLGYSTALTTVGMQPIRHRSTACLAGNNWAAAGWTKRNHVHASHKGHFGDVAVIGGEGLQARGLGMTGAAQLAAMAALYGGAGRVLLTLLDDAATTTLPQQPEIMLRHFEALDLARLTVVCGCGGGAAIAPLLPRILREAQELVLDADALNTIAADASLQTLLQERNADVGDYHTTLLTPHPLEAARLLKCSTTDIQVDRLAAAQSLAEQAGCVVLLKGAGSIVAAPRHIPCIHAQGNALLATAGTGDVLAGLAGSCMARLLALNKESNAFDAACIACALHGSAADSWPADSALTASALAQALHG